MVGERRVRSGGLGVDCSCAVDHRGAKMRRGGPLIVAGALDAVRLALFDFVPMGDCRHRVDVPLAGHRVRRRRLHRHQYRLRERRRDGRRREQQQRWRRFSVAGRRRLRVRFERRRRQLRQRLPDGGKRRRRRIERRGRVPDGVHHVRRGLHRPERDGKLRLLWKRVQRKHAAVRDVRRVLWLCLELPVHRAHHVRQLVCRYDE